jgi:hypothetical protein
VAIFAFCGALLGIADIVLASQINSAHPSIGLGYELHAIAAVVIGGASLMGGQRRDSRRVDHVCHPLRAQRDGGHPFIQQIIIGGDPDPCRVPRPGAHPGGSKTRSFESEVVF